LIPFREESIKSFVLGDYVGIKLKYQLAATVANELAGADEVGGGVIVIVVLLLLFQIFLGIVILYYDL